MNYKMNDFYSPNANTGMPGLASYHFSSSGTTMFVSIVWAGDPKKEIVISYLPVNEPIRLTLTFMVQHLENQIIDYTQHGITKLSKLKREVTKRSAQLSDRNLLLYEPIIGPNLQYSIDDGSLEKKYRHPFQVVSIAEVEEIVFNHSPGYAYPIVVPMGVQHYGEVLYNYYLVDALDGRILYFTGHKGRDKHQFHHSHLELAYRGVR